MVQGAAASQLSAWSPRVCTSFFWVLRFPTALLEKERIQHSKCSFLLSCLRHHLCTSGRIYATYCMLDGMSEPKHHLSFNLICNVYCFHIKHTDELCFSLKAFHH